ncbi:BLOC-1-related complex subunit 5 [Diorhabda sublineata]|uniref:BLOC-1-related complex subunit 5 n=1 Tax=Diorhabda sublineata TaxID=1163346 RepID=UPI0024E12278|nr:BLOC-1-related complex subunit 5 [Diorhabda sublineata]
MGSEHSSQSGTQNAQRQTSFSKDRSKLPNIRRQHTIANPGGSDFTGENVDVNRPGSISPGPSVCSDVDLPYISYTVNRPIGDSPKLTNKQLIKSKTSRRIHQPKPGKTKTSAHNIVVVRGATATSAATEKDPEIVRLQRIPMFLPIMRATLSLPAARDPEILERLDPTPIRNLCLKYQHHLTAAANLVATEQNQITLRIREVDAEIVKIVIAATDRQKKYAKYAEKLSKVTELSHQLNQCHLLLNQTLESIETLNNYLDVEDRLEPFIWTTG